MEEKTLFTLRTARASTEESSENLDSKGHVVAYRFHSSRKKIVNGKVTEITTMNCSVDTGGASWIQQTDKTIGTEEIEISLGYSENTGSEARTATVTFTQEESGNKVLLHVTQEAGVTYTDYLEVPLQLTVLGNTKGSTLTIKVISYSLGSDGSKVAKSPGVGAAPSWANQVSVGQMTGDHEYPITFTATETNSSNTTRRELALITCGTAQKSIFINQSGQPIKKEFTITGLPLNKSCYLFASGSRPQSGGSGTGYLMIYGLDGQVTMSIPVTVNLSSYGDRITADTGDRVTVWTSSGSTFITFSQIGSFTVPSAGGTVSI